MQTIKGKLTTNIATNIANMSLTIIISLFLVPFLIKRLGVESYGLIPLTNYFIQYLTLGTLAINSAVGRYLTIALEQREIEESKRIFNTAFWSNLAVIFLLLLISIPIIIFLDRIIQLPKGAEHASRLLFSCAFGGFFMSLATSAFAASPWCLNRFDVLNGISIVRQGVYLALILLLFSFFHGNLVLVGVALLLSALTTTLLNFFSARHLLPQLRVSWRYFDKASLRKLLSTGGWISINMIGSILYLKIDLLIINRILGPFASGRYASVLQWSIAVRMLATAISSVFGPSLVYLYARNDLTGLALYVRRIVKFLGMMMALPIGLVCGFSGPLLTLWLGKEFTSLSILLILLVAHLCVNVAVYPLFELQTATNKVRLPGIVTCIMGVANFGLALFLVSLTSWGMYGVAAAGALVLTLKNALFTPIYGARIIEKPWYIFVKELIGITVATGSIFLVARLIGHLVDIDTWLELIILSILLSIVYCAVAWVVLLKEERHLIIGKIHEILKIMGIAYAGRE